MKVITSERLPIKSWCMNPEEGALEQARNLANLPFAFHHIALMPDTHQGYGMPIGGVLATENVIIPNAVGVDIGCGMCFCNTGIDVLSLPKEQLKEIMGLIRKDIPVGMNHHDINKEWRGFDINSNCPVIQKELSSARKQLGTLGGGNHFIEFQVNENTELCVMIHSGSRNIGLKIAKHYNDLAQELNKKWYSGVPKDLAFLPMDSIEGQQYYESMLYALEFAKESRYHMMSACLSSISQVLNTTITHIILDVHHNYAAMENHFGKNVMVHRKGATRAREGELGIIPGSQGTCSYIVEGLGNKESFMSCSHGAGRRMSRTQAEKTLVLEDEIKRLDDLGVVHAIRTQSDLDEAPSAYKDINVVMEEQKDLVKIVHELYTLGVIKG
jgi:tRNA-splicing ligase RtcB (3'-phosphate/5'-hydroxy nucleic acid ligase)